MWMKKVCAAGDLEDRPFLKISLDIALQHFIFNNDIDITRSVESHHRVRHASFQLLDHLVAEAPKCISHVGHLLADYLLQERSQLLQCRVGHIIEPAPNEDSIVRLQLEVLSHIIDNECPREVPPNLAEVLNEDRPRTSGMLPVESVANVVILVKLI